MPEQNYPWNFRFLGGFPGGNVRSWLLRIVRNTFYTWLQRPSVLDSMGKEVMLTGGSPLLDRKSQS